MTISDHLIEIDKTGTERESDPIEVIRATAIRHARRNHNGRIQSSAQYAYDAEDDNHKYYMWSTPAAFAFFATLIILACLFAEFLGLFIDLQRR